MSLNPRHVLELVIQPALRALGERYASTSAEQLVLGTAAAESGFAELRQGGGGPAVGLWQMEPATFRDVVGRFLLARPDLLSPVLGISAGGRVPTPEQLAWNLQLGAALCRIRYLYDSEPLPQAGYVAGHAAVWKRVYNSALGAGSVDHYLRAWQRHCARLYT